MLTAAKFDAFAFRLSRREVQKVSARQVLDLDEPEVRIEVLLARDLCLDIRFGHEALGEEAREKMLDRTRTIERRLGCRSEQRGGAVQPRYLDEDGARLLRAAAADGGEDAFGVAAADISRHPDRTFETHGTTLVDRRAVYSRKLGEKIFGHQPGHRHQPVTLEAFDGLLGIRAKGATHTDRAVTEARQRALQREDA